MGSMFLSLKISSLIISLRDVVEMELEDEDAHTLRAY